MKTKPSITRRNFLKIVAIGGLAGLTGKLGVDSLTAEDTVCATRILMGIIVNIRLIGVEPAEADQVINACLDRMEALENILSRFKPESQVSRLNQNGVISHPHPALIGLIQRSSELSQLTGGAFDITVKPLLDLYQENPGILPTNNEIKQVLKFVGYSKIELSDSRIAFLQPGMSITLDGIAKGFIVDEGIAVLKQYGFSNVMVEAGGDLIGLGGGTPDSPWKIGLQDPRAKMGNVIATMKIQNQALATSGDYMQAYTPDYVNHHIIDPRLGHSSPELASASVLAPTLVQADGLATALMVMGKAGLKLFELLPACEAYIVTKELTTLQTPGIQVNF